MSWQARVTAGWTSLPERRARRKSITADELKVAHFTQAHNLHILRGSLYLCYQRGLLQLAGKPRPGRAHRGSQPPLHVHARGGELDEQRNRPVIGWGLGAAAQKQDPGQA